MALWLSLPISCPSDIHSKFCILAAIDGLNTYRQSRAALAKKVANAEEATHAAYTLRNHCKVVEQHLGSHLNSTEKSAAHSAVSVLMGARSTSTVTSGRRSSSPRFVSRSPRRGAGPAGDGRRTQSSAPNLHARSGYQSGLQSPALGRRGPGIDAVRDEQARPCRRGADKQRSESEQPAELHGGSKLDVPSELDHVRIEAPPQCKAHPSWRPPGFGKIAILSVWLNRRHNKNAGVCRLCCRHLKLQKLIDDSEDPESSPHALTQGDIDSW